MESTIPGRSESKPANQTSWFDSSPCKRAFFGRRLFVVSFFKLQGCRSIRQERQNRRERQDRKKKKKSKINMQKALQGEINAAQMPHRRTERETAQIIENGALSGRSFPQE